MIRNISVVVLLLGLVATTAFAQGRVNADSNGIAIDGYDPVAYFTERAPIRGDASITFEHDGATYRFASAENRDTFAQDPQAYAPEYGGYCAWAVGQGYFADIDPEAWVIHDDRLFLNFSRSINRRFVRDLEGNIEQADANWPGLSR